VSGIRAVDASCVVEHSIDQMIIRPQDALIVVDLQNDFLPPSGSFSIDEGDTIVEPICDLVRRFVASNADVYVTRDYHPNNHCSFSPYGGPFPPHCIQGSHGARLVDSLAKTIQPLLLVEPRDVGDRAGVFVVFKGFSPDIDSFGGLRYSRSQCEEEVCKDRLVRHASGDYSDACWTGCFVLRCSSISTDCNAPPDVMSVLERTPLSEFLQHRHRERGFEGSPGDLFICGLALDYCVVDTAINSATLLREGVFGAVNILLELSRAAVIDGGFVTPPEEFVERCRNIRLLQSKHDADSSSS
jgi:nicotinamidase/pyrazinamidase